MPLRTLLLLPALALVLARLVLTSPPAYAEPTALRRISDHLIDSLGDARIDPPLDRAAPLSCLGRAVHAPWQNPYSPLPTPLRDRHVRMTLAAARGVVEYRDAFLVEAPRTLSFRVTPLDAPRIELGYRLFPCGGKGDVTLHVRATDATGSWETRVHLEYDRPRRDSLDAFRELAIDLPLAPGAPTLLELTLEPDARKGRGVLVALAEPVLTGRDPEPTLADTNVLWIVIDAVRTDAMGPERAFSPSPTPAIDRFIFERGTGFSRAYTMGNQTRTSTLAMIGSVPPSIGGFHSHSWSFTSGRRESFYASDPPLITRELMAAGFRVAHFGHNHFLWSSEIIGLDNGFPRVVDFRGIPSDAVMASEEATRFFEARRDERWFLMLNYTAPHIPYQAPDDFDELARTTDFRALPGRRLPVANPTDGGPADDAATNTFHRVGFLLRSYLGELMWVDHNLASVFAKLDALGLSERTLVIVTADHGEVMNPAHDCASAFLQLPCSFNHSVTVYDDELLVPLGLALPGRIAAGQTIPTPVSHADLAPTILDLLGLPSAPGHTGRSLAPALAGGAFEQAPIYADGRLASAFVLGDWKLIVHAPQDDIRPRTRMIEGEAPRYELFDLARDPYELVNLAVAKKEVVDFLLGELKSTRLDLRTRFEARQHAPAVATGTADALGSHAKNRLMLVTDAEPHRLLGRVTSDGTLSCPSAPATDPGMRCDPIDTRTVAIDLTAPGSATFTLELTSTPWGAPLHFELTLDGRPIAEDRLRLGPWGLALLRPGERLDTLERLAWLSASHPPLPQPHEAAVYLWRPPIAEGAEGPIAGSASSTLPSSPEDAVTDPELDQQLGGEVKKLLKDLGYTH